MIKYLHSDNYYAKPLCVDNNICITLFKNIIYITPTKKKIYKKYSQKFTSQNDTTIAFTYTMYIGFEEKTKNFVRK